MVLKEKKAANASRHNATESAIIASLQNSHATAFSLLEKYLEPLQKFQNHSGKENPPNTEKYSLAKQYVPFLAQALKACCNSLSKFDTSGDQDTKEDDLFSSMMITLDCLERMRHYLNGSQFEVDLQRSWLVRRLIARKRFQDAFHQSLKLIKSVCFWAFKPDSAGISVKSKGLYSADDGLTLPPPECARELTQELITLVVGAATDLVICGLEIGTKDADVLEMVLSTSWKLEPWIGNLDADRAEKQRSLLCRGLQKCVMTIISTCMSEQFCLIKRTCSLMLQQCALSSMKDQFCKVARGAYSWLIPNGHVGEQIAIEMCEEAIIKICTIEQLRRACQPYDALDLLDCYARLCQTSKRIEDGWHFISQCLVQNQSSFFVVVGEVYAVGLLLDYEKLSSTDMVGSCTPKKTLNESLTHDACGFLEGALDTMAGLLTHLSTASMPKSMMTESLLPSKKSLNAGGQQEIKNAMSAFRALDFLRRSAIDYGQCQWDAFLVQSNEHYLHGLDCALEKCLLLFCEFVKSGLRCTRLTTKELENFQRGSKSFFPAGITALKLSLMRKDRLRESILLMQASLVDSFTTPNELRWLMSSSYNMGVQLFNLKFYDLACEPFRLSYTAAWARVSCIGLNLESGEPNVSSEKSNQVDAVTDAFSKSNILVDTLFRIGECKEALNILLNALQRWANIKAEDVQNLIPRSLLQLWFKRVLLDGGKVVNEKVCSLVENFDPPLSPEVAGIFLEEEFNFVESLKNIELCIQEKILDFLLKKVYTAQHLVLQRSRILIERTRISRLHCVVSYDSCLNYLTEAVDLMVNWIGVTDNASAKAQLGMTYFLRAICSQEADSSTLAFLDDVRKGVETWKELLSLSKFINKEHILEKVEASGLFHNIIDLLALKGLVTLQCEVICLLVDIVRTLRSTSEDVCFGVFKDCSLNHILCHSKFHREFPVFLTEKLGLCFEELWKVFNKKDPSCLFSALLAEFLQDMSCGRNESKACYKPELFSWERIIESCQSAPDRRESKMVFKLSHALFMLAHSCGRKGKLQEGLLNAKDALNLRFKLVNRCFKLSEKSSSLSSIKEGSLDGSPHLRAIGSIAVNNWPHPCTPIRCSPAINQWRILGKYLESLMQVGLLSEMIGFVDDAEKSFQEGCQICHNYSLIFARRCFNLCLGEVQRKRHLWDLAEKSFHSASHPINPNEIILMCLNCIQMQEVSLDLCMGDLERRRTDKITQTCDFALKLYSDAKMKLEKVVKSSLSRLEVDDLMVTNDDDILKRELVNTRKSSMKKLRSSIARYDRVPRGRGRTLSATNESKTSIEELCLKTNNMTLDHESERGKAQVSNQSEVRKLRPRNNNLETHPTKVRQKGGSSRKESKARLGRNVSRQPKVVEQNDQESAELRLCLEKVPCIFHDKMGSVPCSLQEWLDYQWKDHAICLMAKILLQKGKCMVYLNDIHKGHAYLQQALSVLKLGCLRNQNSPTSSVCHLDCLTLKQAVSHPIEEACILYHLSLCSLKYKYSTSIRNKCCYFASVELFQTLIWLYRAFVLCCEASLLVRKVARMLAVLHVPRELGGLFELLVIDELQPNQVAVFFHELSLGITMRQHHLSMLVTQKLNSIIGDSYVASIDRMDEALRISRPIDIWSLRSIIHEDLQVPCPTVCISIVDDEFQSIFEGSSQCFTHSWLLISRFDTFSEPVSVILPCPHLPESSGRSRNPYDICSSHGDLSDTAGGLSSCAGTPFHDLMSRFRAILDESRQSTSGVPGLISLAEKTKWWEWRMELDARLAALLRDAEGLWLGPWKCLLLGNWSKAPETLNKCVEDINKRLKCLVESSQPIDIGLVKFLFQSIGCLTEEELKRGVMHLLGFRLNPIASLPNSPKVGHPELRQTQLIETAITFFLEEFHKFLEKDDPDLCPSLLKIQKRNTLLRNLSEDFMKVDASEFPREPVVIVFDAPMQVFPWENMPTFRNKELYRMPSIGTMKALVMQRNLLEDKKRKQSHYDTAITALWPTIDPCNTYFVLNPSGDLIGTQAAFEDWFKCQRKWVGKVGEIPTADEYINGLKAYDLFVYLGHGSGDQYFSETKLKRIECNAAAMLMGCSSGRLFARGDYEPVGVPWSYMMAGCPLVIANLWDVTDGDIDRFSRTILHAWLDSDLSEVESRKRQDALQPEMGERMEMNLHGSSNIDVVPMASFPSESRVTLPVGDGRNSCRLPYLIGASPVCYGIPTYLRRA